MLRMLRSLIGKELQQHWPVLLATVGLSALVLPLALLAAHVLEAGSVFVGLRFFLVTIGVLAAMLLGNRLVVQEYQARTQLFLEALPVSRLGMVAVKYGLGLLLLGGLTAAAFALTLLVSLGREPLTARFVGLVAARTAAFVLVTYGFFFLTGFLGRYRIALFLFLGFGLAMLANLTDLELNRFGPFALMDDRFAFERVVLPTTPLLVSLGLAAGCGLLTLLLAVLREGSVAQLLAERMSHREKVGFTAFFLSFLVAVQAYDEKRTKQPFDLLDAVVAEKDGIVVKVAGADDADAARQLADRAAAELTSLRSYLDLPNVPPVFIVARRDLDARRYEVGSLRGAEGLHIQANFTTADFEERRFLGWLVATAVVHVTHARVMWEPNRWVIDGFGPFWASGGPHLPKSAPPPAAFDAQRRLRAAFGATQLATHDDLRAWLRFRERVEDDAAEAVGSIGLDVLVREQGPERCQRFLRAVFRPVPGDVRATLYDLRHPAPRLLEREAGIDAKAFCERWLSELARLRAELSADLARLPELDGRFVAVLLSPSTRQVTYELALRRGPETGRVTVCYATLPPFDDEVPFTEIRREDVPFERGPDGVAHVRGELPETFPRGTRLYATFAIRDEAFGGEIVSGWSRQELR